jgi:hypothetical protein
LLTTEISTSSVHAQLMELHRHLESALSQRPSEMVTLCPPRPVVQTSQDAADYLGAAEPPHLTELKEEPKEQLKEALKVEPIPVAGKTKQPPPTAIPQTPAESSFGQALDSSTVLGPVRLVIAV